MCLRWLWCSCLSKLLGWKETHPEGHPNGMSADVYKALRKKIFPIPKVERNVIARSSTEVAGKALPSQGGSIRHSPTCCLHSGPSTGGTFDSGGYGVITPTAGCGCRGSTYISVGSGGAGLHLGAGIEVLLRALLQQRRNTSIMDMRLEGQLAESGYRPCVTVDSWMEKTPSYGQ
jgi:hypothetical protein